jgi:DeoR/GlpR family transcriptional regulator of sugar metabolism
MPKRAIPPPLTERQATLLEYIIAHVEQHGRQPLLREAAAHFGVSLSAVISYLRALESKGKVRRLGGHRGVELVGVTFRRRADERIRLAGRTVSQPRPSASPG